MAKGDSRIATAQRVVRLVGIALGGLCTFVSFASLVGVVTGNGWARAIGALVLSVGLPALVVDRALPKKDVTKVRPGLVGDVRVWILT